VNAFLKESTQGEGDSSGDYDICPVTPIPDSAARVSGKDFVASGRYFEPLRGGEQPVASEILVRTLCCESVRIDGSPNGSYHRCERDSELWWFRDPSQ